MNIINKIIVILFLILLVSLFGINREEIYEIKHIRILWETASECTLFLKRNDQFPLNKPCDTLLIGSGARNTLEGGLGSGSVETRYFTTCEEGLENAGFKITSKEWLNQYPHLKEKKIKEHLDYIKNMFKKFIKSNLLVVFLFQNLNIISNLMIMKKRQIWLYMF